ncbi:MAG: hypothetical protein DRP89_07455 [Candidatus Neomarinimicrobiota bacterium]|nr:MAG: hypothetical protein DRP89_07455 [Candidatus Neomarinimicrobiota bacterium]
MIIRIFLLRKFKTILGLGFFSLFLLFGSLHAQEQKDQEFSFIVTADMREFAGPEYQNPKYFLGVCEAIRERGKGAFMISPGDIDPPWYVRTTISKVLGKDYLWYPVVGNHEVETEKDMAYLRKYITGLPYIVNRGPKGCSETMYSFNYGNAHFVVINEYCDGRSDIGTDGDIVDATYSWLVKDLNKNKKKYIFVFGHEPGFPFPDMDSGRLRHKTNSLNKYSGNRDRFWKLMRERGVVAYICGHTHATSIKKIRGVVQLDAGHSRGYGDTGAPSTFVKILVKKTDCRYEIYRNEGKDGSYILRSSGSFFLLK